MGKSSAPETPDYASLAKAASNLGKFTETGPTGSVQWTLRPGADPNNPQPGDYIRSTNLSGGQQQLYDQGVSNQFAIGGLGQGMIQGLSGGGQNVSDALYRRATRYYDQNFGDQEAALRARLENSGLTSGSEAYENQLRNFGQTRNDAYADAADRAVLAGDQSQNSAVSRLAQIIALSRGQSPTSSNISGGPDLVNAAQQTYQGQLGAANAQNAGMGNLLGTAGQLGSAYLLSDARLKSDIRRVRTLPSGLSVYDYTIFGKPERGYLAQEVRTLFPESIVELPSGYLAVNYESLGGIPQ